MLHGKEYIAQCGLHKIPETAPRFYRTFQFCNSTFYRVEECNDVTIAVRLLFVFKVLITG